MSELQLSTAAAKKVMSAVRQMIVDESPVTQAFRELVSTLARGGQVNPSAAERLQHYPDHVGDWRANSEGAFEHWLNEYGAFRELGADSPALALARAVPVAAIDQKAVTNLVWEQRDPELLMALLGAGLLSAKHFAPLIDEAPLDWYQWVGLDAIVLRGRGAPPRSVWTGLWEGVPRGEGALPGAELLVESYSVDKSVDATIWLVETLSTNTAVRKAVLREFLRLPTALNRFAREVAKRTPKMPKQLVEHLDGAICELVETCIVAIREQKRTHRNAYEALVTLWRQANDGRASWSSEPARAVADAVDEVALIETRELLRAGEAGIVYKQKELIAGPGLYRAVQEHVTRLAAGSESEGTDRGSRLSEMQGRRRVAEELTTLLDSGHESISREALEAALFNVGVRPFLPVGAKEKFSPMRHEPNEPGVLSGDVVRSIRPGWELGAGSDALVLRKAVVVLSEEHVDD